jgi:hypothetical protein
MAIDGKVIVDAKGVFLQRCCQKRSHYRSNIFCFYFVYCDALFAALLSFRFASFVFRLIEGIQANESHN